MPETEVRLEVQKILIDYKMLKRKVADQNIGTLLVTMDLTEGNCSEMAGFLIPPPVADCGTDL